MIKKQSNKHVTHISACLSSFSTFSEVTTSSLSRTHNTSTKQRYLLGVLFTGDGDRKTWLSVGINMLIIPLSYTSGKVKGTLECSSTLPVRYRAPWNALVYPTWRAFEKEGEGNLGARPRETEEG